jgi:hypothetical protein
MAPAPQNIGIPFATFNIISNEPHDTKDGVSEVDKFRVQVDCWAKSGREAADCSAAIRTALDRYTPGTVAGAALDGIRYETGRTGYDSAVDLRSNSADYFVRVKY